MPSAAEAAISYSPPPHRVSNLPLSRTASMFLSSFCPSVVPKVPSRSWIFRALSKASRAFNVRPTLTLAAATHARSVAPLSVVRVPVASRTRTA